MSKRITAVLAIILAIVLGILGSFYLQQGQKESQNQKSHQTDSLKKAKKSPKELVTPRNKSAEEKQAVMEADSERMNSLGLYYDYANMSLNDTINAFLAEQGIDQSQVAFSYKNTRTNETFSMNDAELMTAGSTYKLPLNMLVVDGVAEGKFNYEQKVDITNLDFEYEGEHDAYVNNYSGSMTIPQMQYGSLVVSENTPAYGLASLLGGMENAYSQYIRYGKSKNPDVPAFQYEGNKTTSSYYIQVLDYLFKHQDKYKDLLEYIGESFPDEYYKTCLLYTSLSGLAR
uniref:serine hydrolase n=1 Tax=Streptococcus sobrinus TaxID=1310 RepID=UPI0005B64BF7